MAESSSDEEELNKVSEQIQIRQQQQQQEDLQQSIYQPPPSAVQHALPLPAAPMVDGSHVLTGEENVPMKSKARKRKLPLPEMFLESGEPLPLPGKKYKENTHFPWLEIVGPTCHSDKQVHSGRDLSAAKKKYRRMRCLDCAAYNAATPWAALWPRKFELQTLVDHSQSSHHMKSEAARKKLGIASGAALPAEDAISALAAASSVSSSSTAAAAGASTAGILGTGIGDPAMANIAAGAGGGHSGSVSAVLALPLVNSADAAAKSASMIATVDVPAAMASETTTMTSAAAAEGGAMLSSSSSSGATALAATLEGEAPPALKTASVPANNNSSIGIPTQPAGGETTVPVAPPANAASRSSSGGGGKLYGTKGAARPDWLYFEGQLCFSDKQAAAAELPAGTKKKYRRVQCLYCLEYLPESPWSQLKPRKFESAVLADHERSGYHQKALELRATHLGIALPLPPLPPQPPSSSGGGGTGSTEAAVKEEALSVVAGAGIPVPVTAAAAAAAAAVDLAEHQANQADPQPEYIITEGALHTLIKNYCRESGVRSLEKMIEKIVRKIALNKVREDEKVSSGGEASSAAAVGEDRQEYIVITEETLEDYIGKPIFPQDSIYESTNESPGLPPGVVMGLAWNPLGGSPIFIETAAIPVAYSERDTSGVHMVTGQLGDVMKESVNIAYTFARQYLTNHVDSENKFFHSHQLHLHVPEGAVSKDGPSAGVAMTTSLLSTAMGKSVNPNVAMTGEISLTGKVLPVGGIKEKVLAARRSGALHVILPAGNKRDHDELPEYVRDNIRIHFATDYTDAYNIAFASESGDNVDN